MITSRAAMLSGWALFTRVSVSRWGAFSRVCFRRTGSALGAMLFFLCSSFVPAVLAPAVVARIDQLPVRTVLTVLYLIEAVLYGVLAVAPRIRVATPSRCPAA